jgi:peptide/nickel transport system substrate-binding protein
VSSHRARAKRPSFHVSGVRESLRTIVCGALAACLLAACSSQGATPRAALATPKPSPPSHAPEIRFALVGSVTACNVWALFDASGYSYNNYAVRQGYWPRLYSLAITDHAFQPEAASDMPGTVRQEGAFNTATVLVRGDLRWDDGSPLTAEDVAFTVNTVLQFQLGFDWQDYYNPRWLDHVEALQPGTIKFFFKQQPNAGVWQYGALQGPIVEKKYWAPKVAKAADLLPSDSMLADIEALKSKMADLQSRVSALYEEAATAQGEEARQVQADLKRQQGNLDQATNDLGKTQTEYDAAVTAARSALYALSDAAEPHLGRWLPSTGTGAGGAIVNEANAAFPGPGPAFDRAVYRTYPTRAAADVALSRGQVNAVLDPQAGSSGAAKDSGNMTSPTRALRFVVFNTRSGPFKDANLREALACILDQDALASQLQGQGIALTSFTTPGADWWTAAEVKLPCEGLDTDGRMKQAHDLLQQAGYTWVEEPSTEGSGQGLMSPNGKALPPLVLLSQASDTTRVTAAEYVQDRARALGIPLTVQSTSEDTIDYAVFSNRQFDAAILGWRVSLYPGYLCDWFGAGAPFQYAASGLVSACGELAVTTDLDAARATAVDMEAALAQDLPMVPLFAAARVDTYQGVAYPFDNVLDGLSAVYGAPGAAVPATP